MQPHYFDEHERKSWRRMYGETALGVTGDKASGELWLHHNITVDAGQEEYVRILVNVPYDDGRRWRPQITVGESIEVIVLIDSAGQTRKWRSGSIRFDVGEQRRLEILDQSARLSAMEHATCTLVGITSDGVALEAMRTENERRAQIWLEEFWARERAREEQGSLA